MACRESGELQTIWAWIASPCGLSGCRGFRCAFVSVSSPVTTGIASQCLVLVSTVLGGEIGIDIYVKKTIYHTPFNVFMSAALYVPTECGAFVSMFDGTVCDLKLVLCVDCTRGNRDHCVFPTLGRLLVYAENKIETSIYWRQHSFREQAGVFGCAPPGNKLLRDVHTFLPWMLKYREGSKVLAMVQQHFPTSIQSCKSSWSAAYFDSRL